MLKMLSPGHRTFAVAIGLFLGTHICGGPISATASSAGELTGKVLASGQDAKGAAQCVVWIEGIEGGTVPEVDTVITHEGGAMKPSVSLGFVGRDFVLRNDNADFHNTHLYMHLAYQELVSDRPLHYGATVYNIPLPVQGKEIKRPIKPYHRYRTETGFIEAICNPHPSEKAYVLVFDHPYCALTEEDGSYSIKGIPAGRYPVKVFRDGVVTRLDDVEVTAGVTEFDLNVESIDGGE